MRTKMDWANAMRSAEWVISQLEGGCERIEIAGSLRRQNAEVGDIELVAVPKQVPVVDMFGLEAGQESLLDGYISSQFKVIKGDKKYKKIDLGGIHIDVYIQPDPATWGVNMVIRTGCDEFSTWCVTSRRNGGALPGYMKVHAARLWSGGMLVETPEEEDFFRAIGLRWIPPQGRTRAFWNETQFFIREGEAA